MARKSGSQPTGETPFASRRAKTSAKAAAADGGSAAAGVNGDAKARARPPAPGLEMLKKLGTVAMSGAALGGKATVVSIRGAMPMLELYSGTTRAKEAEAAKGDGAKKGGGLVKLGFDTGEAGVLRTAFSKGMLEAMEMASVTHPAYASAPVYRAINPETGGFNRPALANFISLGIAASALWKYWNADKPVSEAPQTYPAGQTVAYVATQPGEYRYIEAPLRPAEIRRYAMRQRSLSTPQSAMLLRSSDPRSIVPAETAAMSVAAPYRAAASPAAMRMGHASAAHAGHAAHGAGCSCGSAPGNGCSCGGHGGGGCFCGDHTGRTFPPARYDEAGECANPISVSCETKWRVRECFKVAFCDLLRCMGEELCEKEEPDLGECLEGFLCSLLTCLPDAICPPPETCAPCCHPAGHATDCHCNFAVGE